MMKEEILENYENNIIVDIIKCEELNSGESTEDIFIDKEFKVLLKRLYIPERCRNQKTFDLNKCNVLETETDIRIELNEEEVSTETNEEAPSRQPAEKFWCKICVLEFYSQADFQQHKTYHEKKLLSCPKCPGVFPNKPEFKSHLGVHKQIEKEINYVERTQEEYKSEKNSEYFSVTNRVKGYAKCYWCRICRIRIFSKDFFIKHRAKHKKYLIKCPICGDLFDSRSSLIEHSRTHDFSSSFTCEVCSKIFIRKCSLENHILLHFPGEVYPCDICKRTFRTIMCLRTHIRSAHYKKYKCSVCDKAFCTPSKVKNHMSTHSVGKKLPAQEIDLTNDNNELYECKVCKNLYHSPWEVKKHMLVHAAMEKILKETDRPAAVSLNVTNNPMVFWCDLCNIEIFSEKWYNDHKANHGKNYFCCPEGCQFFTSQADLDAHVATHFPKFRYKCDVCDKPFQEKYYLRNHMTRHFKVESHVCHICKKAYRTACMLKDHLHRVHRKKYQCILCKRLLYSPAELKKHMESHQPKHASVNVTYPVERVIGHQYRRRRSALPAVKNVCCDRCKFKINALASEENKDKPNFYVCRHCSQTFCSQLNLRSHLATHNFIRNFRCDICDKKFRYKQGIRNHIFLHFPQEYLTCEVCVRTYKCIRALKSHLRTSHDFKEKYECEDCKEVFYNFQKYRTHTATHKSDKEFLCHICFKGFEDAIALKRHISRHNTDQVPLFNKFRVKLDHTYCKKPPDKLVQDVSALESVETHNSIVPPKPKPPPRRKNNPNAEIEKYLAETDMDVVYDGFTSEIEVKEESFGIYYCEICDVDIYSKLNFESHKSNHEMNLFGCPMCTKLFESKSDMTVHFGKCEESLAHSKLQIQIKEEFEIEL